MLESSYRTLSDLIPHRLPNYLTRAHRKPAHLFAVLIVLDLRFFERNCIDFAGDGGQRTGWMMLFAGFANALR